MIKLEEAKKIIENPLLVCRCHVLMRVAKVKCLSPVDKFPDHVVANWKSNDQNKLMKMNKTEAAMFQLAQKIMIAYKII